MSQASINNTNFPARRSTQPQLRARTRPSRLPLAADCANVALQFAMAQPTVSTSSSTFNATFASTTSAVQLGQVRTLGAILHSTPNLTVPRTPFFATTLSGVRDVALPRVLNPARNPTLFVATTDGLLHAFDTTVTTPVNNELWSFIRGGDAPSAVELSVGERHLARRGTIVKDVVWQRTLGGTSTAWQSAWHTMLVAGSAPGARLRARHHRPRNTGTTTRRQQLQSFRRS